MNFQLSLLTDLYIDRCKSQIWARFILDTKKFTCKQFQDFLKKKSESIRSADLWTYLDSPRSRIVKYPLLLNEILRQTTAGHVDESALKRANELLSDLLKKINEAMGDSECKLAKARINIRPEYDPDKYIENADDLVTQGFLKDSRGVVNKNFNDIFKKLQTYKRTSINYVRYLNGRGPSVCYTL